MDLETIRDEVKSRGFDDAGDTRIDRWINKGYQRICDRHAWPFLETTTTGNAPLAISDVRAILNVTDTTNDNQLVPEDYRTIREVDPSLEAAGTPENWYLDGSTLRVFPLSTTALSVRYIKFPATLSLDADTPVLPTRYHDLLVDFAVCEAYKDSDNLEAWQILRGDVEEQIREMEAAILVTNLDAPLNLRGAGASSDW